MIENMSKNKIVTSIFAATSLAFILMRFSEDLGICSSSDYRCLTTTDKIEYILYVIPLSLLFSVISLFTKEAVFNAWWKFARFAIPAVLVASFAISLELHHNPGGFFNVDNEVDRALTSLLYLFFILGSAFQMYRGFRAKE
jgi:hypothetical protein